MSAPLSDILSVVAAHGKSQASAFLQGEAVIAGSPDQEIWEHLARHDILWDGLTVADQDQIRDSYLEAFKSEAARRLTPSDPATSPLPVSLSQEHALTEFGSDLGESEAFSNGMAEVRKGTHEVFVTISGNDPVSKFMEASELNEEQPFARFAWYHESGDSSVGLGPIECWMLTEDQSGTILGDLLDRISSPSPASSVAPAPLVPEVVKALDKIQRWSEDALTADEVKDEVREAFEQIEETASTALRNYSPAPSPSVDLLREAKEGLEDLNYCNCDASYNQEHRPDCSKIWVPQLISKINAALA